jgi:hypothetical protein
VGHFSSTSECIDHICNKEADERRTTMMPNYYIREQLAQAHRLEVLREAEHERLLAQLPQSEHHVLLLSWLLLPLRALRMRLKKQIRRRIA